MSSTKTFKNHRSFLNRMKESKFIKIRCPKCNNEQNTFGKASTEVKCLVCGTPMATPTGGKSKINARVLEVLN